MYLASPDLNEIADRIDHYLSIVESPDASPQAKEFANAQLLVAQSQWKVALRRLVAESKLNRLSSQSIRRTPPPPPAAKAVPTDLPWWATVLGLIALIAMYCLASTLDYQFDRERSSTWASEVAE